MNATLGLWGKNTNKEGMTRELAGPSMLRHFHLRIVLERLLTPTQEQNLSLVCLSVLTTGVLLASWCVQITTYWLLFFFLAIGGMLARVRLSVCLSDTSR